MTMTNDPWELLALLRTAGGHWLSVDTIAQQLNWPVGRVERAVTRLESVGVEIERVPHRGLSYRGPAPRLCVEQIRWGLEPKAIGRRIRVWQEVESTNDVAARALRRSGNDGYVVLAEHQTRGRGRQGHGWFAPPESCVLMSVLLLPPRARRDVAWLTCLGAVAVSDVLVERLGLGARIKWPNDILVDGRKVCGILVEERAGSRPGDAPQVFVLGIGVNVNVAPDAWPDELRPIATSLSELVGETLDRSDLIRSLLTRLDHYYTLGMAGDHASVWERYRERAAFVGCRVQLQRRDRQPTRRRSVVHKPATPAVTTVVGRLVHFSPVEGFVLEVAVGESLHIPAVEVVSVSPAR